MTAKEGRSSPYGTEARRRRRPNGRRLGGKDAATEAAAAGERELMGRASRFRLRRSRLRVQDLRDLRVRLVGRALDAGAIRDNRAAHRLQDVGVLDIDP